MNGQLFYGIVHVVAQLVKEEERNWEEKKKEIRRMKTTSGWADQHSGTCSKSPGPTSPAPGTSAALLWGGG